MALITCPECGNLVSEKAEQCPNCGYPVSEIVKNKKTERKQLAVSQKEEIGKRVKIAVLLVVVIIIVLASLMHATHSLVDEEELYDGVAWGSDLESVKQRYPLGNEVEASSPEATKVYVNFLDSFIGIEKLYGAAVYSFNDNGLYEVSILLESQGDEEKSVEQIANYYTNILGEPESDSDSSDMIWIKQKSKIELIIYGSSLILINYQDINYEE